MLRRVGARTTRSDVRDGFTLNLQLASPNSGESVSGEIFPLADSDTRLVSLRQVRSLIGLQFFPGTTSASTPDAILLVEVCLGLASNQSAFNFLQVGDVYRGLIRRKTIVSAYHPSTIRIYTRSGFTINTDATSSPAANEMELYLGLNIKGKQGTIAANSYLYMTSHTVANRYTPYVGTTS